MGPERRRTLLFALGALVPILLVFWLILRADPVELRWKFQEGDRFRYRIMEYTPAGDGSLGIGGVYTFTVKSRSGEGNAELEVTCDAVMRSDKEGFYDSAVDPPPQADSVATLFTPFIETAVSIEMTPQGYITKILPNELNPDVHYANLGLSLPLRQMVYGKTYMSGYLSLPGYPVSPGDSWSVTLGANEEATADYVFRLDSVEGDVASISYTEVAKSDSYKKIAKEAGIKRYGTFRFSIGTGRLLNATGMETNGIAGTEREYTVYELKQES